MPGQPAVGPWWHDWAFQDSTVPVEITPSAANAQATGVCG